MITGMLQIWVCLHRHLNELLGSELLLCLTLTAGALPAVPVMWFSQHVVDYCGHSNLLIIAFIFYIVRYTGNVYLVFFMLYVFFWVIPWHLNFICLRFRILCLFHLHRQVGAEWINLRIVWVANGGRFGSKIASANSKEGDGVGVGPVTQQVVKG